MTGSGGCAQVRRTSLPSDTCQTPSAEDPGDAAARRDVGVPAGPPPCPPRRPASRCRGGGRIRGPGCAAAQVRMAGCDRQVLIADERAPFPERRDGGLLEPEDIGCRAPAQVAGRARAAASWTAARARPAPERAHDIRCLRLEEAPSLRSGRDPAHPQSVPVGSTGHADLSGRRILTGVVIYEAIMEGLELPDCVSARAGCGLLPWPMRMDSGRLCEAWPSLQGALPLNLYPKRQRTAALHDASARFRCAGRRPAFGAQSSAAFS